MASPATMAEPRETSLDARGKKPRHVPRPPQPAAAPSFEAVGAHADATKAEPRESAPDARGKKPRHVPRPLQPAAAAAPREDQPTCPSPEQPSKRPRLLAAPHAESSCPAPEPAKQPPRPKLHAALHTKGSAYTPALHARAFDADPTDHCETPFKAYRDIEPILFRLAQALRRTKGELRIYDPYYCEGSVVKHLSELGFTSVINRNEDFYAQIEGGTVPEHDVIVTNPPFSGDHIERALRFCVLQNGGRPWLLLLPSFIHKKRTCAPELARSFAPPMFLVPASTYTFWSPGRNISTGHARSNSAAEQLPGKPTTPFECMWYVHAGILCVHAELKQWWVKKHERATGCVLATSAEELPDKVKPKHEKRANPRARKRMRAKGIVC
ncbi:hypothetical protein T492DRAFT_1066349 [Pavlovales sp. CCMP2436]|nr:hypothetical protein T492DRAFT_1066349 [Pavlovales sp. CCMP2436]